MTYEVTCPECTDVPDTELEEIARSVAKMLGVDSEGNRVFGDYLTETMIGRILGVVAAAHRLTEDDIHFALV